MPKLSKPPWKLWHGLVITVHLLVMQLLIHALTTTITMLFLLSSHPGYKGWLYVFVPVLTPPRAPRPPQPPTAADSCSRDKFRTIPGFLLFLAGLMALTCRLPVSILVDFRRDLDLEFSMSNMEFAISQLKMVRLPRSNKQNDQLNFRYKIWVSGLTLVMTLTVTFQGKIWNLLYLKQLSRNGKWTNRLNTRPHR